MSAMADSLHPGLFSCTPYGRLCRTCGAVGGMLEYAACGFISLDKREEIGMAKAMLYYEAQR